MAVTVYSATLTGAHAAVVMRVLTVETGTSLMGADCNLAVTVTVFMSLVELGELTYVVGTTNTCLVYIDV